MRRITIILAFLSLCGMAVEAQPYSFTFRVEGCTDSVLYIGQHYRDEIVTMDSAAHSAQGYLFKGKRAWELGVYALVRQDRKTVLKDFLVDDSRNFTISGDATLTDASIKVRGSKANELMYEYMATQSDASRKADSLRKAGDGSGLAALDKRMRAYERETNVKGRDNLFIRLIKACDVPEVPDSIADKAVYYRMHYWDSLFDGSQLTDLHSQLLHSPQLFGKMNFFFFNIIYHADSDTIIKEVDRLMGRIGDDTALARYVLQFVEPRYFRSTRNIGWDAVWCHIASEYVLKGRCPWMRESEVYLARQNYNRIRQSIIGAHGQELIMMDTTQIDAPEHWHSSHLFPQKYVILWFWDPDCHHCQEQSAELKTLYDSLLTAPYRPFEVYAVGYESDVEKWKRYVREHDFRWVNVGGNQVNIDYQEAYNVHGAPTMIILNERRDIIMNKVLPVKSLLAFLDEYEKKTRR